MYATPESVEAPLPVPPPHNHPVEPPEYEVRARCRSRWLQGLHPYLYVGPSRCRASGFECIVQGSLLSFYFHHVLRTLPLTFYLHLERFGLLSALLSHLRRHPREHLRPQPPPSSRIVSNHRYDHPIVPTRVLYQSIALPIRLSLPGRPRYTSF